MNNVSHVDFSARPVPFNNFFGDEFLTLLYCSNEGHLGQLGSKELPQIRALLNLVADRASLKHERAAAAVEIGRFVRGRDKPPAKRKLGMSSPPIRCASWFRLARELGSVVGASELANTLLARDQLSVAFDAVEDVLPRIVPDIDDDGLDPQMKLVSDEIVSAWRGGATATYRHLQRKFAGWTREEFKSALTCISCYLTFSHSWTAADLHFEQRRSDLAWINPVWNALIDIAPDYLARTISGSGPEALRQRLIEQRLAILHGVHNVPGGCNMDQIWVRLSDYAVHFGGTPPTGHQDGGGDLAQPSKISVLLGEIPSTAERAEREQLKQYESLASGVSLVSLPSLDTLRATQADLINEFPWAHEVITTVLSDLIARRSVGSLTLGMGTFLLVGEPGSGKTRFAQRLSDRLGTPNLVCNLAGMNDSKAIKGSSRGWASARSSRMVEFIRQTKVANPFFILDEIDKLGRDHRNGDPSAALLDLLEPGNARRYMDVFLMAECDLSHCIYIATANSLLPITKPLLSRMQPVIFPRPGPEHANALIKGVLMDFEASWGLPAGVLSLPDSDLRILLSLSPREMRAAIPKMLARGNSSDRYRRH